VDGSAQTDRPSVIQSVTLVVADSRPLLLRGLEHICSEEPGFEVVATCTRGDAVLDALRIRKPDILILDNILPPSGGLWVLRQMHREKLPTRTILLADRPDERYVHEAVRLGVGGILRPDMTLESLRLCVRRVHAGEQWLEWFAVTKLLNRRPRGPGGLRHIGSELTPRQVEIVRLATEAITTREIAARLMVTEGTVKVHLHNIYEKLQVEGRVGLVRLVMKQGRL
jgi:two-component system nitrate/nitrite response regulator NarL